MTAKIAIVGAGVIGLSLAWRLLKEGAKVVVIDAGAALPSATAAAAGMLAPSFESRAGAAAEPLYRFARASLDRWRDFAPALEDASGMDIDYRPEGVLGVAFDEGGASELRARWRDLSARGARAALLSGDEARSSEPGLSPAIVAGLLAEDDGQVDPRRLALALRVAALRRGGEFIEGVASRVAVRGGAACAVECEGGARIEADRIVLAAGARISLIAFGARPPVFPVKGEALALDAGARNLRRVVRGPGAYLCPKSDGRLVIGATEIPEDVTAEPSPEGIEALKRGAAAVFPDCAALAEVERWAGLRPATPDAAPVIGPAPDGPDGLFYALGHYRNGVLFAPETAELLAPSLLGAPLPDALKTFSPARFG